MNREGLTWSEWYAAATYGVPAGRRPRTGEALADLRKAWREGEDPTDYAATLAR